MVVIEVILYKTFKEKIAITKRLTGKFKCEDLGRMIYIERVEQDGKRCKNAK